MKQIFKTLLFFFWGISVTLVTSCQKENGTSIIGNDDNTGVELRMRNESNGGDYVDLLRVEIAYNNYSYDSYVCLYITGSNNFYASEYFGVADIVCVGNVNGLSKIKNIPESGWAEQVAVQPGSGYIIRNKNPNAPGYSQWCRYARVYVEEWIEGVSGGILGAVIRYQDDWQIIE